MNVKSAGKTDIGLRRKVNEDSYLIASDLGLYILADGIGGSRAGDVASRMVVDNIENYWRKLRKGEKPSFVEEMKEDLSEIEKHIINSIRLANITVYKAGRIAKYKDMCSTVAILLLQNDSMWAANVGDSRIYLFDPFTIFAMGPPPLFYSSLKEVIVVLINAFRLV